MLIRQVKCRRFAGLKDKELTFGPGLNVLLGPNEAGKSTLVDAIYHTLLQDATVDRRRQASFLKQYTPHPSGDFFDGALHIELSGQQLKVEKEWGRHPRAQLELPNGNLVRDEAQIRELLREHLQVGEGSLATLVFARQSELKEAVKQVLSDTATQTELGSLLRKTVMELDGVSIEQLKEKLQEQLKQLLGRWDWERQRPEGGRGIDNPWKAGTGAIVNAYYQKETLRQQMRVCQQLEVSLHQISENLKQTGEKRARVSAELEMLLVLDDDINKRAALEPQLEMQKRLQQELMQINKDWPKVEMQADLKREELAQLRETVKQLGEELKLADQLKVKQAIDQMIEKLRGLQAEIGQLQGKLAERPLISKQDIATLEQLRDQQIKWEAKLQAGRMIGELSKLNASEGWLTKGFGERERIVAPMQFSADGYLKLTVPEVLELEVKALDIDMDQARQEYQAAIAAYRDTLAQLAVSSTEQAREVKQQQDGYRAQIKRLEDELTVFLKGRTLDDMITQSEALAVPSMVRDAELIRREMQQRELERVEKQGQLSNLEQQMNAWESKYGQYDEVLLKLVEVKRKADDILAQLSGLATLPEGMGSIDEFRQRIRTLRQAKDDLYKQTEDLRDSYRNAQANLPEESYEELQAGYQDAEARFNKLLKQAQGLLRVQQVLEAKLAEISSNPFSALAESFKRYLSCFTAGNYSVGDINEQFELIIHREDGVSLPLNILSAGTYDGVALALRFAMLEHLFQGRNGLVVLDDCLVDLDPQRKQQAAETIQEFAKTHQVIFTTCDPATAELLGGTTIRL